MNNWHRFENKIPSKPGFYAIESMRSNSDIEYIFMNEIGHASFGSVSVNGFVYKYFGGGPYVHWRFMTEYEKYHFYDDYLKKNGLTGLHNLKIYHETACNPLKNIRL